MTYRLTMQAPDGSVSFLLYDPHQSTLTDDAGNPVPMDYESKTWKAATPISPESPGKKHDAPTRLKIQLGLKCNYSCSYCLQSSEIPDATVSNTHDVDAFMANLDAWLKSKPGRIEFWGGEPLVYWKHLQKLVPAIRDKFPEAKLVMVTNGSLLDDEKIDFIDQYAIDIGLSHDAMGHHLRGFDPFDDAQQAAMFRKLWQRIGHKGRMGFNTVLTAENHDIDAIKAWLDDKMGEPVAVSFEGVVHSYDAESRDNKATWTAEQYADLQYGVIRSMAHGMPAGSNSSVASKAWDFIDSLRFHRPSSALGQKCGMDRPDQLAVDLKGNVTTCQNVGANGKHGIGHVSNLDAVSLDTSWHWSKRENCDHCPVLQMCKGACMYAEGVDFDQSCESEFHYNSAIMAGALYWLTGKMMVNIEGDIRRPKKKKVIPILSGR